MLIRRPGSARTAHSHGRASTVWSWLAPATFFVALIAAMPSRGEICEDIPTEPYDIDIRVDIPGAVTVDRSLTRDELGAAVAHLGRGRVLGLMRSDLDVSLDTTYGYLEAGTGYCFWLQTAIVNLRFPTVEIYVAREYRPGTCAYRAILDHESDHLEVARNILDPYAAEMRAALTSLNLPTPNAPWRVASIDAAQAQAHEVLNRLLDPIYARMQADMAERQAWLDSPQEYRDVFRRCRNW